MDRSRPVSWLWHMYHEARRVGVVYLILVRQLGMLSVHGKIDVGVLLLLRIDDNILAILVKEVQVPPPTLVRVMSHILMSRPCFRRRAYYCNRMARSSLLMGVRVWVRVHMTLWVGLRMRMRMDMRMWVLVLLVLPTCLMDLSCHVRLVKTRLNLDPWGLCGCMDSVVVETERVVRGLLRNLTKGIVAKTMNKVCAIGPASWRWRKRVIAVTVVVMLQP